MTESTLGDELTIGDMAAVSGLSIHTLRYYERIGLIAATPRSSSGHRRYSSQTAERVESLGYLPATGLGIEGMRRYLHNLEQGDSAAADHAELLTSHAQDIDRQIRQLQVRQSYIEAKAAYWQAVADGHGDAPASQQHIERAQRLAAQIREQQ